MTDPTHYEDVGMAGGTGAGAGGGSGTHLPALDWPWTQRSTLSEARASDVADLPSNLRAGAYAIMAAVQTPAQRKVQLADAEAPLQAEESLW